MKKIFLFLLVVCFSVEIYGQELGLNTSYYFNRQLFNPSLVADKDFTSFNFIHKRQWVGINDAPVINYFNFQLPLISNFSIGLNVSGGKSIILNNFGALFSTAYKIQMTHIQTLHFGLSLGFNSSQLDLTEVDNIGEDQVLLNTLENSFNPDGRFGITYKVKDLQMGFALTQLFGPYKFYDFSASSVDFTPLSNYIISAKYCYEIANSEYSISPELLYRGNDYDALDNIWESALFFDYKNIVVIGGSYKSTKEISGHFMLTHKNKFRFRYSYDSPQQITNGISTGSHEIQLSYLIGRKKNISDISKSPTNIVYSSDYNITSVEDQKNKSYQNFGNNDSSIKIDTIEFYERENPDFFEIQKGFYIVAGFFNKNKDAEKLTYKLSADSINFSILYSSISGKYIVQIYQATSKQDIETIYIEQKTILSKWNTTFLQVN